MKTSLHIRFEFTDNVEHMSKNVKSEIVSVINELTFVDLKFFDLINLFMCCELFLTLNLAYQY